MQLLRPWRSVGRHKKERQVDTREAARGDSPGCTALHCIEQTASKDSRCSCGDAPRSPRSGSPGKPIASHHIAPHHMTTSNDRTTRFRVFGCVHGNGDKKVAVESSKKPPGRRSCMFPRAQPIMTALDERERTLHTLQSGRQTQKRRQ